MIFLKIILSEDGIKITSKSAQDAFASVSFLLQIHYLLSSFDLGIRKSIFLYHEIHW